jgi:hypothetical protein
LNKKIKSLIIAGSISVLSPYLLYSQTKTDQYHDPGKRFSVMVYGTYISSAELQNDLNAESPFLRDASIDLAGGYGYGGEILYDPGITNVGIKFYLSSEYIKVRDDELAFRFENDSASANVRFVEEYQMIPLEAGLKWPLPISSDKFKIYIGGGGGIYWGDRTRSIGSLKTEKISSTPGLSLNILSGIEYYVGRNLSLDFELKFREASFESENKFSQDYIIVNGETYALEKTVNSRIIVDGVRISFGLKYNF